MGSANMRQILLNSAGAVVARVPRPIVEPGSVLVRVRWSLISVGTELAPLRSQLGISSDASSVGRSVELAARARHSIQTSLNDPGKALDRVKAIARRPTR